LTHGVPPAGVHPQQILKASDEAERSEAYHPLAWFGRLRVHAAAIVTLQLSCQQAVGAVAFKNSSAYLHIEDEEEDAMAQEPLATKGNFLHIYDFRVTKGKEEEFIRSFEEFDYSDGNPMHKSRAQVKDGVLCRDTQDPQRFFLIAEWSDIEEHARIRKVLANEIKPQFIKYIEGGTFIPKYVEVVSSTPDEILNKAAAAE
jgi:heme-degrading monooxygenase HmoA